MAVIIELLGWGGKCREHFCIEKPSISIGRSHKNDVVIKDNYVSPEHLRLESTDDGWRLLDLGSRNGTQVIKKTGDDDAILSPNSEIRVGRTRLRITSPDILIDEAKPLHPLDKYASKLSRIRLWLPLLLLITGIDVGMRYLESFVQWEWKNIAGGLLMEQMGLFLVAGLWALVGRFMRHENYFFGHLSLILVASLLMVLSDFLWRIFGYNASSPIFVEWFSPVVGWMIFVALLASNMTLATNFTPVSRWITSTGIMLCFVMITLAGNIQMWGEFSPRPQYFSEVVPPALQFVDGDYPKEFISGAEALFDAVDLTLKDEG